MYIQGIKRPAQALNDYHPKGFSCRHATGKSEGEFLISTFVILAGNYRASFQTAYATGGKDIGAMILSMILAVNTRYRHHFNY